MSLSEKIVKRVSSEQAAATGSPKVGLSASEMLKMNSVMYSLDLPSNLVVSRQRREYTSAQSEVSTGGTGVITLQTGSSYIDTFNSYLKFTVQCSGSGGAATWNPASDGSICNLIESIVVFSKTGVEMSRLTGFNLYRFLMDSYQEKNDFKSFEGTQMGYGMNAQALGSAKNFVIPLHKLESVFKPDKKVLMPPFLASGMRIEINFVPSNHLNRVLTADAGTIDGYTVSKLAMVMDCLNMNEDSDRKLSDISNKSGLEYVYNTYYHVPTPAGSANINLEINKSVSKAMTAFVAFEKATPTATDDNSFNSEYETTTKQQMSLGSLYFPNKPIASTEEGYNNAVYSLTNLYDRHPQVNLSEFQSRYGVVASNLERNNSSELSALPINSSRSLLINLEGQATSGTFHSYLVYKTIARTFLSNVLLVA